MNHTCTNRLLYLLFFLSSCFNALEATDTTQFNNSQPTSKSGAPTTRQSVGLHMWNTPDPELIEISKRKPAQQLTHQDPKKQKTTK